jgi:hypothetical protein
MNVDIRSAFEVHGACKRFVSEYQFNKRQVGAFIGCEMGCESKPFSSRPTGGFASWEALFGAGLRDCRVDEFLGFAAGRGVVANAGAIGDRNNVL